MKRLLIIPSAVILLCAFGDTNRDSFSQDVKSSIYVKKKTEQIEQIDAKIKAKTDSLRSEIGKTNEMTEQREKVIEIQKETGAGLQSIYKMANKTLIHAQKPDAKLPMIFITHPKIQVTEIPVTIKEPVFPKLDTIYHRTVWDKLFFRKRDRR